MPFGLIFMSEVLPTLIVGGGGLVALGMILKFMSHRRGTLSSDQVERLIATMENLPASIDSLHQAVEDLRNDTISQGEDVRELSGRIEFAERMLVEAKEKN